MKTRTNHAGRRFGRLVAIEPAESLNGKTTWLCKCDCGNSAVVRTYQLVSYRTMSCGCLRVSAAIRAGHANITHGKARTRAYRVWKGMRQRCFYEKAINFKDYGGRGITVCDQWNKSFQAFIDDMGSPEDGMQLDRIDHNGNYEPGNCRWVTPRTNSRNKRNNNLIEFNGVTRTITEWAAGLGITHQALHRRMNVLGWPKEKALSCEKMR